MYLGTLLEHQTYVFNGRVEDDSASQLLTWLMNNSSQSEVTIVLNTVGGILHDGVALFDAIQLLRDKVKVNIVALGACQSAGVVILLGARPECRFSGPNTRFMVHPPGMQLDIGKVRAWGPPPSRELMSIMDELAGESMTETYALREALLDMLVANSTLTREEAEKMYDDNAYFTPDKALETGILGSILEPDPVPTSSPAKKFARLRRHR